MPAFEPAARVKDPDNESPVINDPAMIEYVKVGSASPNAFVFASALTVSGAREMVRFEDTNVIT